MAAMSQPGGPTLRTLFLPLSSDRDSPLEVDDEDGEKAASRGTKECPELEVQLQYEAVFLPGSLSPPPPHQGVDQSERIQSPGAVGAKHK